MLHAQMTTWVPFGHHTKTVAGTDCTQFIDPLLTTMITHRSEIVFLKELRQLSPAEVVQTGVGSVYYRVITLSTAGIYPIGSIGLHEEQSRFQMHQNDSNLLLTISCEFFTHILWNRMCFFRVRLPGVWISQYSSMCELADSKIANGYLFYDP